jgi:hypothetical protein
MVAKYISNELKDFFLPSGVIHESNHLTFRNQIASGSALIKQLIR